MDSERVTAEPPDWVVALYLVISACTVAAAFYLVLMLTSLLIRDGLRDYCYHGGGGELIALALYVLYFGWPVIALQVLLAYFTARRIGRSTVVAVTSALPIVVLIGYLPCI